MSLGLRERAQRLRAELAEKVLPYWFDTAQDREHGGYRLADDAVHGRGDAPEKQLVTQSRMIWGLAHAHLAGFSTSQRSYLGAAEQGHRFLRDHFLDRKRGGYFWKTDPSGRPISDVKYVYAQAFAIFALVELHRAGGSPEPLTEAMDLHRTLQRRAHDRRHQGWLEHFDRAWRPLRKRSAAPAIEVPGWKSATAHLHLLEAYAELYAATRDEDVRNSLCEAIEVTTRHFFPERPGETVFHRQPDWKPVDSPKSTGVCYGHNAEFAWLLIRAQQALGAPPDWSRFAAYLDHALTWGWDAERGGLYYSGSGDQPAAQTHKVWWVQAELLAALTEGLQHEARPRWAEALVRLLDFVWTWQVDPRDGIWLSTVAADGTPTNPSKANSWKANYHDLRAVTKFIEAFGAA